MPRAKKAPATQPVKVAKGQPYGLAQMQREQQQKIPLPQAPRVGAVPTPRPLTGGGPLPGSLPPLNAPTQRPGEPVMAGAPMGAGPGPEALGMRPNDSVDVLRGLLLEDPDNDALASLVSLADQGY